MHIRLSLQIDPFQISRWLIRPKAVLRDNDADERLNLCLGNWWATWVGSVSGCLVDKHDNGEGQFYGCQLVTIRKFCQRLLTIYFCCYHDYHGRNLKAGFDSDRYRRLANGKGSPRILWYIMSVGGEDMDMYHGCCMIAIPHPMCEKKPTTVMAVGWNIVGQSASFLVLSCLK